MKDVIAFILTDGYKVAAGDTILVQSASATITLFRGKADGPNFTDGWVFPYMWINGITITSMTSGQFDLYCASK